MFGIEWLRNGVPVDKETSVLTSAAEAIAAAKSRRRRVADRQQDGERNADPRAILSWPSQNMIERAVAHRCGSANSRRDKQMGRDYA
jgi:hypothetical protein